MSLGLDLTHSRAKIARAREHLETLEREVGTVLAKGHPYTVRVSDINQETGWCSAFLVTNEFEKEVHLGVLIGDVVHNLRSALDYIVCSELVKASGVRPTNRHIFPIFAARTGYEKRVGTRDTPKLNAALSGLTIGIREIWDIQPFHTNGEPRLDLLLVIHEFSNGDKHRILSGYAPVIRGGVVEFRVDDNTNLVQCQQLSINVELWEPGKQYEIARLRFRKPFPLTKINCNSDIDVDVTFTTKVLDTTFGGIQITIEDLWAMCARVDEVVSIFENL